MPKTRRPQQGRQPSKECENFRKKRKVTFPLVALDKPPYFLSNGPQSKEETVVASENLHGKLLKIVSSQILKTLNGTPAYHQPFKG